MAAQARIDAIKSQIAALEQQARAVAASPEFAAAKARENAAQAALDAQPPGAISFRDVNRLQVASRADPDNAQLQQQLAETQASFQRQRAALAPFVAALEDARVARAKFGSDINRLEQRAAELDVEIVALDPAQASPEAVAFAAEGGFEAVGRQEPFDEALVSAPGSVDSAGAIQTEAETARDDGAASQLPSAGAEVVTAEGRITPADVATGPTNAAPFAVNEDSDSTASRTLTETQAVPTVLNQPGPANTAPQVPGNQGQGASTEESQPINPTQAAINSRFPDIIVPRANTLDQYSSYTYSISIYLMGPKAYRNMIDKKTKTLDGMDLIIQSAGAPVSNRNQDFLLDYYIDNLEVTNVPPGKGSRGAHSVTELSFSLTEPNGITLFKNLNRAIQSYNQKTENVGPINYTAQNYLMAIRFYGYDAAGELVPNSVVSNNTDQNAIVEKFIPFQFAGITFKVANRLVEYQCKATAIPYNYAMGQARGTIPYNIQLTATTLDQLLTGNAGATPTPASVVGLVNVLNNFQTQQVNEKKQQYADVYNIVFPDGNSELQKSRLRPPGATDLTATATPPPRTASAKADGSKQSVNNNNQNYSATAGISIVQFLDSVVRNTTYIFDQQTQIKDKNGKLLPTVGAAKRPSWYRIGMQSVPIPDKYDNIRKDYAYEITYSISMWAPPTIVSEYFPDGRFIGTHKKYNYWFTGENTSVISFEMAFNYQYYLTVTAPTTITTASTTDYREYYRRNFSPTTGESEQGPKNAAQGGASAADYLYSPGDNAQVEMEIIGDPAFMAQGEVWEGVSGESIVNPELVSFLSDGTINYDSQAVLFEVAFNTPADYDLDTGLIDIARLS